MDLVRIGSIGIDDITKAIALSCIPAINNYDCMESPVGTNYQVPAGKTLYISEIKFTGDAIGCRIQVSYGTDAIDDAAGPPANNVLLCQPHVVNAVDDTATYPVLYAIPALKYPHCLAGGGGIRVNLKGILVTD